MIPLRGQLTDRGYHSNEVLKDLKEVGVRSYVPEPDRGKRNWDGKQVEQAAVYGNRRRIRGARGKRLLKQRGEKLERSFAHLYETGGMRRTHLRGHENILKRLVVHAGGFNLSLIMRRELGAGTPRGNQDSGIVIFVVQKRTVIAKMSFVAVKESLRVSFKQYSLQRDFWHPRCGRCAIPKQGTLATGC